MRAGSIFIIVAQPSQVPDEMGVVLRSNKFSDVLTYQL